MRRLLELPRVADARPRNSEGSTINVEFYGGLSTTDVRRIAAELGLRTRAYVAHAPIEQVIAIYKPNSFGDAPIHRFPGGVRIPAWHVEFNPKKSDSLVVSRNTLGRFNDLHRKQIVELVARLADATKLERKAV